MSTETKDVTQEQLQKHEQQIAELQKQVNEIMNVAKTIETIQTQRLGELKDSLKLLETYMASMNKKTEPSSLTVSAEEKEQQEEE